MKQYIGKMRDQVVFAEQIRANDGMGGNTYYYASKTPVWGYIEEKPLNRFFDDNTTNHQKKVLVVVRKDDTIQQDWVLRRDDKEYIIDNLYSDLKYTYVECLI